MACLQHRPGRTDEGRPRAEVGAVVAAGDRSAGRHGGGQQECFVQAPLGRCEEHDHTPQGQLAPAGPGDRAQDCRSQSGQNDHGWQGATTGQVPGPGQGENHGRDQQRTQKAQRGTLFHSLLLARAWSPAGAPRRCCPLYLPATPCNREGSRACGGAALLRVRGPG